MSSLRKKLQHHQLALEKKAQLAALGASHCAGCKRKLVLSGDNLQRIGFRCHECRGLLCHRCGKTHFGDLSRYSVSRRFAHLLIFRLKQWLGKGGAHARKQTARRKRPGGR